MSHRLLLGFRQWRLALHQSSPGSQLAAGLVLVVALAMISYSFKLTGQLYIEPLGANLLSWILTILLLAGLLLGWQLPRKNADPTSSIPSRVWLLAEITPYVVTLLATSLVILLPYYLTGGLEGSQPYFLAGSLALLLLATTLFGSCFGLAIKRLSQNLVVRLASLLVFSLLAANFLRPETLLVTTIHQSLVKPDSTGLFYLLFAGVGALGLAVAGFDVLALLQKPTVSPQRKFLAFLTKTDLFRTSFHPFVASTIAELLKTLRSREIWIRFLVITVTVCLMAGLLRSSNVLEIEPWLLAVASFGLTIFTISLALDRSTTLLKATEQYRHLPNYWLNSLVGRGLAGLLVMAAFGIFLIGLATPELYRSEIIGPVALTELGIFAVTFYFGAKLAEPSLATTTHRLVLVTILLLLGLLPAGLNQSQSAGMISWLALLWIIALLLLVRSYRLGRYRIG